MVYKAPVFDIENYVSRNSVFLAILKKNLGKSEICKKSTSSGKFETSLQFINKIRARGNDVRNFQRI